MRPPPPDDDDVQPRHVLVVEDDRVNQSIVCAMLRNAGYRTSTADDGAQALALLSCNDYDLVLMDWQMPDMDGLEVTRRLRAGAAGRHGKAVPIVALTANAFVEDRTACLAAGMNDFLTKPVLAASLEATVGRWTQHVRRTAAPPSVFGVLHPSP
jgi:CheY-like chemotaxis protein